MPICYNRQVFCTYSAPLSSPGGTKMKKSLSLILCLCLAASLLTGLSARACAETPPEERDLIILYGEGRIVFVSPEG